MTKTRNGTVISKTRNGTVLKNILKQGTKNAMPKIRNGT
jgi:hypothetical protein